MKVLVSIIIPVYNASSFLVQRLECLQKQTLSELEIICIDDGSTDNSAEMIKSIADHDTRVKLIQQNKSNAGVARNIGLKYAVGEYIYFADADDFCERNFIEKMYIKALSTKSDIVLCTCKDYNTKNGTYSDHWNLLNEKISEKIEVFSKENFTNGFFNIITPEVWLRLYRREFILKNNINFQSLSNTNDLYFSYMTMALANRISFIRDKLCYYRVNNASSIQQTKYKDPLCICKAFLSVYDELNRLGLYSGLERSYVEATAENFAWNIRTIRNDKALIMLYIELIANIIPKTNLTGYPIEYYSNKADYELLKQIPINLKEMYDKILNEKASLISISTVRKIKKYIYKFLKIK